MLGWVTVATCTLLPHRVQDAAGDQVVVVESEKLLFDPYGYYCWRLGRPGYDPATCAAELLEPSWQLFGPNDVM